MRLENVKGRVCSKNGLAAEGRRGEMGEIKSRSSFHVVGLFFTKLTGIAVSIVWLHISQRNVGVLIKVEEHEIQPRGFATLCKKSERLRWVNTCNVTACPTAVPLPVTDTIRSY